MDLINQLESIEQEIKKNNQLQLAIFSQIDNISNISTKLTKIDEKTKDIDIHDIDLQTHVDKLSLKIKNHREILTNDLINDRDHILLQIKKISSELPDNEFNIKIHELQGDIITKKDIQLIIKSRKTNQEKIKKINDIVNRKINIIHENIDKSIENLNKNQDKIQKNIETKSITCKLNHEEKFPKLFKNQKDLTKYCTRHHKRIRGENISSLINKDIQKRKEYTSKYTRNIMKELLSIRKKITKKNKGLSKLISQL